MHVHCVSVSLVVDEVRVFDLIPKLYATNLPKQQLTVLMYSWYALLFHLPCIFIVVSSTPCLTAVVAASILKLCPEYGGVQLIPAQVSTSLTFVTKLALVRGCPLDRTLYFMYDSTAALPSGLSLRTHPQQDQNRSVFDAFIQTLRLSFLLAAKLLRFTCP